VADLSRVVARSRGRRRSESARRAVLTAACELLERDEFAAITIEAIARRAKVSKATIYRWWPNKAAVVTDSFLELIAPEILFEDTGSQKENLRRQMHKLAQVFSGHSGKTIAALIAEGQFDAEVADAFHSRWISVRRELTKKVIQRGVSSGEFRADLDVEAAIDALYGPIYFRLLIGHLPLEPSFIDKLVNYTMAGIEAPDKPHDGRTDDPQSAIHQL
jgi:AcrR family transcriptional regulator